MEVFFNNLYQRFVFQIRDQVMFLGEHPVWIFVYISFIVLVISLYLTNLIKLRCRLFIIIVIILSFISTAGSFDKLNITFISVLVLLMANILFLLFIHGRKRELNVLFIHVFLILLSGYLIFYPSSFRSFQYQSLVERRIIYFYYEEKIARSDISDIMPWRFKIIRCTKRILSDEIYHIRCLYLNPSSICTIVLTTKNELIPLNTISKYNEYIKTRNIFISNNIEAEDYINYLVEDIFGVCKKNIEIIEDADACMLAKGLQPKYLGLHCQKKKNGYTSIFYITTHASIDPLYNEIEISNYGEIKWWSMFRLNLKGRVKVNIDKTIDFTNYRSMQKYDYIKPI